MKSERVFPVRSTSWMYAVLLQHVQEWLAKLIRPRAYRWISLNTSMARVNSCWTPSRRPKSPDSNSISECSNAT